MELRNYGTRALFVGLGAFSVLLCSSVPASALSVTNGPPRKVCVAKNGSYVRPITTHGHCKPWETLIKFDELVRGPRGYTGPRGPVGPQGEDGLPADAVYESETFTVTSLLGATTQTFRGECDENDDVIAGGYSVDDAPVGTAPTVLAPILPVVVESYPDNDVNDDDEWVVTVTNPPALTAYNLTVWSVCVANNEA